MMTLKKVVFSILAVALMASGCNDDPAMGGTGGTGGQGTGGTGAAPTGRGSASLTIGDETWEFDEFGCAFGYDATESQVYSFSSNSFGEHSNGARVQMQANIRDDTGQERIEGDGVIYEVDINDIDDFQNPAVSWDAVGPAATIVVRIDGDHITAE
ncbi:MAG: hypothetical protein JRJ80_18275, partial [Deltaproteobacteria bacterium]|nr:hypothetical protein [Deltaproteobacteria bacterium]